MLTQPALPGECSSHVTTVRSALLLGSWQRQAVTLLWQERGLCFRACCQFAWNRSPEGRRGHVLEPHGG